MSELNDSDAVAFFNGGDTINFKQLRLMSL